MNEPPADGEQPVRPAGWLKSNQGVGVCLSVLVCLLLIHLLSSDWTYEKLRDGFRLGFFTVTASAIMLMCTVTIIFDRRRNEVGAEIAAMSWRDWVVVLVAVLSCFTYFKLAWNFGFILVSPVFLCAAAYVFGVRPLRSAALSAVVMTLATYTIFRLIGIKLPSVIIGF